MKPKQKKPRRAAPSKPQGRRPRAKPKQTYMDERAPHTRYAG